MRKISTALSLIIISSLFLVSVPRAAWAGVRIDKPKIRFTVAPGGHVSDEIKVENTGKEPITVRVYLEDWVYKTQDGGKEFMPKGTTPLSCAPWINYFPADIQLAPLGEQMVRFTVSVPQDAKGGHFCVMFFETGGGEAKTINPEGAEVTVKVYNRLGSLFYIDSDGTVSKVGEIRNMKASQNLNHFLIGADFFNTGNTDISGKGTFNVFDSEGYVYLRGAFPEFYTLPGDKAALTADVASANFKPGAYDVLLTLEFENGGNLVQEATFQVGADGSLSGLTAKQG